MTSPATRAARLRGLVPIAVSAAFVAYLLARIDLQTALAHLSLATLVRFAGPLLAWNFATLAIEAHCLHRVTTASGFPLGYRAAARIKSASYLLSLIHYAAGATGLAFLIRGRTGASLAAAASAVFVLAALDMTTVAGFAVAAGALQDEVGGGLRTGLLAALVLGLAAGLATLRTRRSLGPLERLVAPLRELALLSAIRGVPTAMLVELLALRVAFLGCYVAMSAGLFWAFGVEIGLVALTLRVAILLVVSTLPIAVAGIGTAQLAFVTLFSGFAPEAQLLSMSILLSLALVLARAALGLTFAGDLVREARGR